MGDLGLAGSKGSQADRNVLSGLGVLELLVNRTRTAAFW